MKTMMLVGVLVSTVAIGAFFAAASRAEDNDGGSIACLNGPTATESKRDSKVAPGVVYDATKTGSAMDTKTSCTNSVAMSENDDDDGDEN